MTCLIIQKKTNAFIMRSDEVNINDRGNNITNGKCVYIRFQ